ncbi:MAG: thioredoxin domain-containing protein [Pirellulales bacterium]
MKAPARLPSAVAVFATVLLSFPGPAARWPTAGSSPHVARAQETPAANPPQEEQSAEPQHRNRLADETSPYLLLHAHNPVDWYPWGEEALAKAKRENKMIFLSVGYSSCYWCHVMERETFSNDQIAQYMNEHFVCIKVDREERPDVDDLYMTSLQVFFELVGTPQSGGWPLSMFLTPEGKPVMGGTYYPPRAKDGHRGFDEVLRHVQQYWEKEPDTVRTQGDRLAAAVRGVFEQRTVLLPADAGAETTQRVRDGLAKQFDEEHGGFGYSAADPRRPKFPEPSNLEFLLHRAAGGDERALGMLRKTLDHMARGGIRDHVGGGFHRYSTDRTWRIPHFEKMLYDNGQLAGVYARAHATTGELAYRRVTEELVDFVLREMTSPEGGFYSALDAETDAVEGEFYVWTKEQLRQAVTSEQFALLEAVYNVGGEPNFEERYVLVQSRPLAEVAGEQGRSEAHVADELAAVKAALLKARSQRKRPLTDTKILASWNGLMIGGLADAGRILEEPRYVAAARRAANFVLSDLRSEDGRLWRTYSQGEASLNAYLDDYAFVAQGLLALHLATGEARWLEEAQQLTDKQIELFWDEKIGGFYFTSHDHEELFARIKKWTDGALPAGNSVAAANLLALSRRLSSDDYRQRADKTVKAALPLLNRLPAAAPRMAVVNDELLEK